MNQSKPWSADHLPKKILVMRFQATGDVVITLPWVQDLKDQFPEIEIHFLTRAETSGIPKALTMFSKLIEIGGGRKTWKQLLHSLVLLPFLWVQRYDVVIDLQNHWLSRLVRRLTFVKTWTQFDRLSTLLAGERTRIAIDSVGIANVKISNKIYFKNNSFPTTILKASGWREKDFIILNPAGAFASRNWPIENYITFAQHWLAIAPTIQFVVAGYSAMGDKANQLKLALGDSLVDITGLTTQIDVFKIVGSAKLVLSEDSGLMHMACIQRVPTVAIFGSTRSYWSGPMGEWSYCFNSADLPCGNCMLQTCSFGDNHCLTRWSASEVFEKSLTLSNLTVSSASR